MKRLMIIGAGGHGKVVADTAQASGSWKEIIFLDDRFPELKQLGSWIVSGDITGIKNHPPNEWDVLVAMGENRSRLEYLHQVKAAGYKSPVLIHPAAWISPSVRLGRGCVVFAGAMINADVVLGTGCIINTCASVDHDCRLSDGVHISPGANLGGNVEIGHSSWVGIGVSIRHGVCIGANVVVGAGAAVVSNVEDGMTVVGVPARPKLPNCHNDR